MADKAKPGAASAAAPGCKRNPSVSGSEPTYTVELVAGWFRRWLGASAIRQRDRDYAREVLCTLAAAGRLPATHHLPLLNLTEQETEALILAARAYAHLSNGPTLAVLRSALDKVTATEEFQRVAITGNPCCGGNGVEASCEVCRRD